MAQNGKATKVIGGVEMDVDVLIKALQNTKPFAFRIPVAVSDAIDRFGRNRSETLVRLLLSNDSFAKVVADVILGKTPMVSGNSTDVLAKYGL